MDKLTEASASALQQAVELAKENAHPQVAPVHLFSALLSPTTSATGQTSQTLLHSILNKGESCRFSSILGAQGGDALPPPHPHLLLVVDPHLGSTC